jgi:hypothetical protein
VCCILKTLYLALAFKLASVKRETTISLKRKGSEWNTMDGLGWGKVCRVGPLEIGPQVLIARNPSMNMVITYSYYQYIVSKHFGNQVYSFLKANISRLYDCISSQSNGV